MPVAKPAAGAEANLQLDSVPLKQWKDLDAHETGGPIDLLFGGLDDRARRLIRSLFRTWLSEQCDKYVKRIEAGLRRHYFLQVATDLDATARQSLSDLETIKHEATEEIDRARREADARVEQIEQKKRAEVAELDPWEKLLRKTQNTLAQQFEDSRNYVVSADLAAKAEKEDELKQAKLDEELDKVLNVARFGGPFKKPEDLLAATRRAALEGLVRAESLPSTATTLLQMKRDTDRRLGKRAVERLVDVVAINVLSEFPRVRDLFDALAARKLILDLTQSILPNAMDRARAYWHLNPNMDTYREKIQKNHLCGTVVSPVESNDREEVMQFLKDRKWVFWPLDPSERGAEGELVLVHEAHGYALQSLLNLPEWKKSYDRMCREGRGAARHLDNRVVPQLPDLVGMDDDAAIAEAKTWDLALLGIVLGKLKWSGERSTFMYNPTDQQPIEVGMTYEAIAWWLRNNPRFHKRLEDDIHAWFNLRTEMPGRAATPDERAESARKESRRLALLGLVLRLLGERCMTRPRTLRGATAAASPPEHTLTIRLRSGNRSGNVDRYLGILTKHHDGIDRKAIENELCRPSRSTSVSSARPPKATRPCSRRG